MEKSFREMRSDLYFQHAHSGDPPAGKIKAVEVEEHLQREVGDQLRAHCNGHNSAFTKQDQADMQLGGVGGPTRTLQSLPGEVAVRRPVVGEHGASDHGQAEPYLVDG